MTPRRFLKRLAAPSSLLALACVMLLAPGCGSVTNLTGPSQKDFLPIHEPVSPEHQAQIDRIPKYRRAEESTYLTFSEWYLVFNPQEYAQFLASNPPSTFPYFEAIDQFWGGYAQVYGITRRHYPFNAGNHLMLLVIGGSSTAEYLIKAAYEKTFGRYFEWTAAGARTEEEDYATKVARDYGDFIPTQPWFDFPFGEKFAGLWSSTKFFGPNFPRKLERKIAYSAEYGAKFLYGGVIRLASHAVYGVADTEVFASVTNAPGRVFDQPDVKKLAGLGDDSWIITVPHYQGFTDTVPLLARQGVDFIDISGNDEILATIIAPALWNYDLADGQPLFTMRLLMDAQRKRVAVQVPVKSLGQFLRNLGANGLKLEHLFDY